MLKRLVRSVVPAPMLRAWRRHASERIDRRFTGLSPADVFGTVYREKMWGVVPNSDYCSGTGSHQGHLVTPYVTRVRAFLESFSKPPDAVDLGCGDFNVGSLLRDRCAQFVAADVVPELVERNARAFAQLAVSFRCLDIVTEELPSGEVGFLRQVLQHLTNAQITAVVPKLYTYRWLVVTEQLPSQLQFPANRDKPIGPGVRERYGSGVVLTRPPFGLQAKEEQVLCTTRDQSGCIHTVAYRLRD